MNVKSLYLYLTDLHSHKPEINSLSEHTIHLNEAFSSTTIIKRLFMPRQPQFNVNYTEYAEAVKSVFHGKMYFLFTDTDSQFAKIAIKLTKDPYNHVAVCFDKQLNTLITYLEDDNDGLNRENVMLKYNNKAQFELYSINITEGQLEQILAILKDMTEKGSTYDLQSALLKSGLQIKFKSSNNKDGVYSMFCSQFVYHLIREIGAEDKVFLYKKDPEFVTPYDIVKMSNKHNFKFVNSGNLFNYYIKNNPEIFAGTNIKTSKDIFNYTLKVSGPDISLVPNPA
jgi:hypothetical protein